MKRVFQLVILTAISLMGLVLILGACTVPAATAPAPAPTLTPTPVVFVVSDLTIVPDTIRTTHTSTIGVTVTNTGEQPGTYTVVLKVQPNSTNKQDVQTQDVTLAGGASQKVTFVLTATQGGTYEIMVDQLIGFLVVASGA
ncbi:MAG: CARDB domain-containing protein [Dehalococcoidales bacterium]|nr:CARDB domain-containing protein [Dehalococcoidales bacterium]